MGSNELTTTLSLLPVAICLKDFDLFYHSANLESTDGLNSTDKNYRKQNFQNL
jgi:hypothetical protein